MVETFKKIWTQYRYACIVILVGLLFLLFPTVGKHTQSSSEPSSELQMPNADLDEEKLTKALKKLEGAGEVYVLLSYKASEEHIYTKDNGETVLMNVGSGTQKPLEKKIVFPTYQGAVIICAGAGNASVRADVVDAVHQYTGLRSDQISVLPLAQ